ncbi:MAG: methylated-DNA--[protein]-cysteine S-methyltransferase [Microthrixaceae bacterium]
MSTDDGTEDLERRLSAIDAPSSALDDARATLVARADDDGTLDVAYRVVDSPIGSLLVAASTTGVVRVAFEVEDHDRVLDELAQTVSPRLLHAPGRTDDVARQLERYFAGQLHEFDVAVDLQLVSGFRRRVVEHLVDIPYGRTASYGSVAAGLGNAGASRAVGSACSHNPVPVLLPCHRVVRSDGSIGQYLGGSDAKVRLLELESAGNGRPEGGAARPRSPRSQR